MLGIKSAKGTEAMSLLRKDHETVKKLFDRFEKTKDEGKKKEIVEEACRELKVHATVEEELFYPALRQKIDDKDGLLDEADEEHHEAKILIAELELMKGDEENYDAKFTVLSENVRHHIKEEESEMFPEAKKTMIDFDLLGERMWERKQELLANGVPPAPESRMVEKFGIVESPSRKAQGTISVVEREGGVRRARKH